MQVYNIGTNAWAAGASASNVFLLAELPDGGQYLMW